MYLGNYKEGDKVKLLRNITVCVSKGIIFRTSSDETAQFNKGSVFEVVQRDYQSMTTPESYVTYTIKDNNDDTLSNVPEWYLEVVK
jgi:hypothetical protein